MVREQAVPFERPKIVRPAWTDDDAVGHTSTRQSARLTWRLTRGRAKGQP
jgi:hypothetical protein